MNAACSDPPAIVKLQLVHFPTIAFIFRTCHFSLSLFALPFNYFCPRTFSSPPILNAPCFCHFPFQAMLYTSPVFPSSNKQFHLYPSSSSREVH
jgi:hypothetical protein